MPDASNLDRQLDMTPTTLKALLAEGVVADAPLSVEYFFKAPSFEVAQSLGSALSDEVDDVTVHEIRGGFLKRRVEAWSVAGSATVTASEAALRRWVTDMVILGERHQSEFDGWGASV